jgi:hypothetical protein
VDGDCAGGARGCIGVGVMTVRCTGQPRTRSTSLFYTPLPCHPQTLARCSSVDSEELIVRVDVLRLRARLEKAVSISNDIMLLSRRDHGCSRMCWSKLPTIEKTLSTTILNPYTLYCATQQHLHPDAPCNTNLCRMIQTILCLSTSAISRRTFAHNYY